MRTLAPTTSSLLVTFEAYVSGGGGGDVLLYELSQRTIYSGIWSVMENALGQQSTGLQEAQIVTVRVDADLQITDGTFQLGLTWANRTAPGAAGYGNEPPYAMVTPPIPYNVASGTLLKILNQMVSSGGEGTVPSANYLPAQFTVQSVVRCDDRVDYTTLGYNSFQLGALNCPAADQGSFSWLVLFQSTASAGVPSMFAFSNSLGDTWTGEGPQVVVSELSRGRISPTVCVLGTCSYTATGLDTATPYAYRYRALTASNGWTDYSAASAFVMTLAATAPSRPRPPMVQVASATAALLQVMQPPAAQGVMLVESQYRLNSPPGSWLAGPTFDTTVSAQQGNFIIPVDGLTPNSSYEARIRSLNAVGYSLYSTSSTAFVTPPAPPPAAEPSAEPAMEPTNEPTGEFTMTQSSSYGTNLDPNALNAFTGGNNTLQAVLPTHPQQLPATMFIGQSIVAAAQDDVPARTGDFYYLPGVGVGGVDGGPGGDGYCAVVAYNPRVFEPFSNWSFAFTGDVQQWTVPLSTPTYGTTALMTFKCWGGGGGSTITMLDANASIPNMYAAGGGGGFAQVTFPVYDQDVLQISIGGGGSPANGAAGGAGGYGGGGNGGDGFGNHIGGGNGGGGGGGATYVTQNGNLMLVAAGGGGAGSSDDCCASGGAGGGEQGFAGGLPMMAQDDVFTSPWPTDAAYILNAKSHLYVAAACDPAGGAPAGGTLADVTSSSTDTAAAAAAAAGGELCLSKWEKDVFNDVFGRDAAVRPAAGAVAGAGAGAGAGHAAHFVASGKFDVGTDGVPRRRLQTQADFSSGQTQQSVDGQPGEGGAADAGGSGGYNGMYSVSTSGPVNVHQFGVVAVFRQNKGLVITAQPGQSMLGGTGGGGIHGGGGGGGGYYGGGGGGGGINGAGGGGGSSYAYPEGYTPPLIGVGAPGIVLTYINNTCASVLVWVSLGGPLGDIRTFDMEVSDGWTCDDYIYTGTIPYNQIYYNVTSAIGNYTVCGLTPLTKYSVRAVPNYVMGRGEYSVRLLCRTLCDPQVSYWEPLVPRRHSFAGVGYGYTDPVTTHPNLDKGVEIFSGRTLRNDLRYADAPTALAQALPSARMGHSMTADLQYMYMFGGKTDGYSCADVYVDTLNLGSPESGREVHPCNVYHAEVNEFWSFDLRTYEWTYLNTSHTGWPQPPPRQQHAAALVGHSLYVFGGKTDLYLSPTDNMSEPLMRNPNGTYVFGDLWRLTIPAPTTAFMPYIMSTLNNTVNRTVVGGPLHNRLQVIPIPKSQLLELTINGSHYAKLRTAPHPLGIATGDGLNPRSGMCIDKMTVTVRVSHTCVNNLQMFLMGPGDMSGSFNYQPRFDQHRVILFDQPPTNGSGCSSGLHDITFDDDSARLLYTCCTQLFSGVYKPQGPLAEFMGDSPSANWTLIVSDQVDDKNYGHIVSWGLNFTMSECTKAWVWQNMSWASKPAPGSDLPPARYQASTLVYGTHIYLFGGRDEYDAPLRDLYRFDTNTSHWLRLTPAHFDDAFKAASSVGANFVLTPLGLVRYGGYFRQPFQTTSGTNAYEDAVYFMDINTMRWQRLTAVPWPAGAADGSGGGYQSPPGRYYGGMVFVSSKHIKWRRDFSYRALFDQLLPSTHANFVGSMVDSLLLFGGFNGAAGSVNDGSTGGFLNDVWMLRLTNWSTPGALDQLRDSVQADCAWRQDQYMRSTCLSTVVGATCSFREILLLARCSLTNLTMA